MRALTIASGAPHLALADVAEPSPAADQAVVAVHVSSLNRGEVLDLSRHPAGFIPGWDVAGVVAQAAEDGSGPPPGARVLGLLRSGAWAERAAIGTSMLATVPPSLSDTVAAALPTAGLTALRSFEVAGLILGKRVAVTGATGGVGGLAVQLARESGAEVTALVRDVATSGPLIAGLGASPVESLDGRFDVIIDAVGGQTFGHAIEHLASRGVLVNIATDPDDDVVAFSAAAFDRAVGARIYTLNLPDELAANSSAGADLARLCRLVANRRLDPQIEFEGSWRDPGAAMDALLHRRVGGKVVLHLD